MQLEAANNKAMNRRMRIFREYRIDCVIPRIFHVVDFASWRSLSNMFVHFSTRRKRDSGKIGTKIDRLVPLFSMMLLTSSASCEAQRIDVISSRGSSLSLSLSFDSSSFHNLFLDTNESHYSPLIYASRGKSYVPSTISLSLGRNSNNFNGSC